MTRNGDKNGDSAAQRRWHQRPLVIPMTVAITFGTLLVTAAVAYTRVDDRSIENAQRIERIEMRIEKRLDQIFEILWGSE